jgi:hypothetical protein
MRVTSRMLTERSPTCGMEGISASEMSSNFYQAKRRHIPEDITLYILCICLHVGHAAAWLVMHYSKSRKAAGSIPIEVVEFSWHNHSSRTMALGSTLPLTDELSFTFHKLRSFGVPSPYPAVSQ